MASSLKIVAPLVALLLLFAIPTPAYSQLGGLGGLLGGLLGGGGGTGGLLGGTSGLLGGVTGGLLGGGLTGLTGTLLCTRNLILCPSGGTCPPLVNASVSLNLGNIQLAQTVTNAVGAFQLIPRVPVPNILSVLPNVTVRVTLPPAGCSAVPTTGVLSSPLMVTQGLGSILNLFPISFF